MAAYFYVLLMILKFIDFLFIFANKMSFASLKKQKFITCIEQKMLVSEKTIDFFSKIRLKILI